VAAVVVIGTVARVDIVADARDAAAADDVAPMAP